MFFYFIQFCLVFILIYLNYKKKKLKTITKKKLHANKITNKKPTIAQNINKVNELAKKNNNNNKTIILLNILIQRVIFIKQASNKKRVI